MSVEGGGLCRLSLYRFLSHCRLISFIVKIPHSDGFIVKIPHSDLAGSLRRSQDFSCVVFRLLPSDDEDPHVCHGPPLSVRRRSPCLLLTFCSSGLRLLCAEVTLFHAFSVSDAPVGRVVRLLCLKGRLQSKTRRRFICSVHQTADHQTIIGSGSVQTFQSVLFPCSHGSGVTSCLCGICLTSDLF